jgi:hypothetical protein
LREATELVAFVRALPFQGWGGVACAGRSAAFIASGCALSGCGARVNWTGAGNLLWMLKPLAVSGFHGCEAASKDHEVSSPATIRSFAMGVRVQ